MSTRLAVISPRWNRAHITRHATTTALVAVSLDAGYSIVFWLILGRSERRNGLHPVRDYFLLIGQLSVEAAVIIHLWQALHERKAEA